MYKRLIGIGGVALLIAACALNAQTNIDIPEPAVCVSIPVETVQIPEPYKLVLHYDPIPALYTPREFTIAEAQMLMRIAQAEAGNQGVEGMMLIMAVVLNRVKDPDFPSTIQGVVFQKGHFSTVSNGSYDRVELSPEVHIALAQIEMGMPIDEEIIAFESADSNELDKWFTYAYTVGNHKFYVKKGET